MRTAVKAVAGSRILGSVQAHEGGEVLHISRLVVAPDCQGRGIGSRLLAAVEASAEPDVRTAARFTGERSAANLAMYGRRGYCLVGTDGPAGDGMRVVHLTKELGHSSVWSTSTAC